MERNIYPKVFAWMFIGLLVSFGTGLFVSVNPNMLYNLYEKGIVMICLILELVFVIWLSARITKMKPMTAKILFLLYSLMNGFTLTSIFLSYEISSIVMVFGIASLVFAIFALVGATTKIDLTKIGNICLMGLFALIITMIINIFLGSSQLDFIINIIGVLLFVIITAFDMQQIKKYSYMIENEDNAAIYGALQLYLDFINLFLHILELIAESKD